jgi:hypothetical protein
MHCFKPWLVAGTLMLGVGALGGLTAVVPAASVQEEATWITDYAMAKSVARQSGKPIFLVFR